jgi:homoserine kinase type II
MAVYTEVAFAQAAALMAQVQCGVLTDLRGIQGGIENTNYFATCEHEGQTQEHVLTVFERLSFEQLPFYLHLMRHLAEQGIPVPKPAADAQGEILHRLCDKPAAVVNRLAGRSELAPTLAHCAAVGAMLARTELAIVLELWLKHIPEFEVAPDAVLEVRVGAAAMIGGCTAGSGSWRSTSGPASAWSS